MMQTSTKKRLRIVYVTNNYTPYAGGVVSSISVLVEELLRQGHQVFIITLDFLGSHHQDPDYVFRICCPVKFRYKKNYMAIPWRMHATVARLIDELKPDVIHAHHPWLLGSAAQRVARARNIPFYFTFHTLYEHYAHYVPLPEWLTKIIINRLLITFCNNVDRIVAPSCAVKTYIHALGITVPVTMLPSPIAHQFYDEVAMAERCAPKLFSLLVVSRLVKEKNLVVLLDLFARLNARFPCSYTLTLVGYGEYEDFLQAYAYHYIGLTSQQVRFVGKKEKHELVMLYKSADLFLFSSHSDTQGLVLAEAMSCGLPVIALDGPGQRDCIVHGENGFLVNSLDEMYEAVVSVAQDQQLYQRLKIGALQYSRRYQPSSLVERLIQLYI